MGSRQGIKGRSMAARILIVRLRLVLVLVALVLLHGCGSAVRIPEDSFYRLAIAAPPPAVGMTLPGVLQVHVDAAAPIYRDRSLLYSEAAQVNRLQRYHYHHWVDTPPRLLQHGLVQYLRASARADQIVTTADRLPFAQRLQVNLERFEHVRGADKVVVQVRVALTAPDEATFILQRTLQVEEAVSGKEFSAVVTAYEQAVTRLFAQLAGLLAKP